MSDHQLTKTASYTFYFNNSAAAGYAVEAINGAGLSCTRKGDSVTVVAESYYSQFGQSRIIIGGQEVLVVQNVALARVDADGSQIWPPTDEE